MTAYLEKFRSGMRQVQSQQLLTLINRERNTGSITSVQEFRERLEELTAALSSEVVQPTLTLFLGELREFIDSESYNFMLRRIEDDLAAAYTEMNSIDEIIESHETIINDVVFKNLDTALNELEAKIESFEFLKKNAKGFDNSTFNTFRLSDNQRESAQSVLFLDPKGLSATNLSYPAQVDTLGEKLVLKTSSDQIFTPAGIRQLYDTEATGSELEVQVKNSNINNIVDNRKGTFWGQNILLSAPREERGVITKLEIDLGPVQSVNNIQIEPLTLYPIDISNIEIVDANGQVTSILTVPIEIKSANRLFFKTVSAKKIILKFKNKNYSPIQFETKPNSPLPDLEKDLSNFDASIIGVKDELNSIITSPRLKTALGVSNFNSEQKSYYEYFIGFDNIKVGLSSFEETSIFTSKAQRVKSLGQLAIQVNEKRPVGEIGSGAIEYTEDTYPDSYDDFYHGSLEYYVVKKDFSEKDALLNSNVFAVPPLGVTQIRHERLLLTSRVGGGSFVGNDTGSLQFFTLNDPYDETIAPTGTIRVYRNGQLLPSVDLNPLVGDGWVKESTLTQATPGQSRRMSYAIRILNPNPNNIYTVSYTPAVSTTNSILPNSTQAEFLVSGGLNVVDLTGNLDAWLGEDNVIYFKNNETNIGVSYSTVTLAVVLRRNTASTNLSPVLEDYLIATGTRNANKFGE